MVVDSEYYSVKFGGEEFNYKRFVFVEEIIGKFSGKNIIFNAGLSNQFDVNQFEVKNSMLFDDRGERLDAVYLFFRGESYADDSSLTVYAMDDEALIPIGRAVLHKE